MLLAVPSAADPAVAEPVGALLDDCVRWHVLPAGFVAATVPLAWAEAAHHAEAEAVRSRPVIYRPLVIY